MSLPLRPLTVMCSAAVLRPEHSPDLSSLNLCHINRNPSLNGTHIFVKLIYEYFIFICGHTAELRGGNMSYLHQMTAPSKNGHLESLKKKELL